MSLRDLTVLSAGLQSRVRIDDNGEVSWQLGDAPAVIGELAQAGLVVLGLDMREYDEDESFLEIPWSVYEGADPVAAGDAALQALAREQVPGEWVLVTWCSCRSATANGGF